MIHRSTWKARAILSLVSAMCAAALVASCARPRQAARSEATNATTIPRVAVDVASSRVGIGETVENVRIETLAGATLSLDDLLRDRRALVIAMASAECPLAIEYAPRMAVIEREFEGRVAFLHVNPVDGESIDAIRAMIQDSGLRGAYARDTGGQIRREIHPKTTTEVFVLTQARQIVYRGAIDDQYRLGGKAAKVQREYLRDALRAVLDGRSPNPAATSAPGCLVDMPRARNEAQRDQSPSIPFYPRVAEVFERNCVQCHQPGGAAPFSLISPASVEGRTAMIAAVVREGIMPPNHGLTWSGPEPMVRDRTMSRQDQELLLAWLESDRSAPQAMPAEESRANSRTRGSNRDSTWSIGTPDYILITPGPTLQPQEVPKVERYFIPINLDQDAWIEAIECRPVMRDSVAVAHVWLVRPGESLPAMDQFPGSPELFATFSRSDRVVEYPTGSARLLPAHCVLVVDLQGRAMPSAEPSQLRIALRFAKDAPRAQVRTQILFPDAPRIAPGDAQAQLRAIADLPGNVRIVALRPLMGPRAQALRVTVAPRNASPLELIDLGRYDWRWLIRYPLRMPLETTTPVRISATWTLNNSAANPVNPDPSVEVSLGIGDAKEAIGVAIEYEQPMASSR